METPNRAGRRPPGRAAGRSGEPAAGNSASNSIEHEAGRSESSREASPDDLQSLLGATVRELVRRTGADHACAWIRTGDGPILPAASWRSAGEPIQPGREDFELLCALPRATDLGGRSPDPGLARLASSTGLSAAVGFSSLAAPHAEAASGVLLLGGPDDPPGQVRPRTLAALEELAGQLAGPVTTALALNRLRRLDRAVERLDRQASLGDLVSEIVHEIRNPLVSVKTFLQLLPDRIEDAEFVGRFRSVVLDEVSRLQRLLDSVLRHGSPSPEGAAAAGADLGDVCESVAQLVSHRARERDVELDFQIDPSAGRIAMSRDALLQVLLNLTLNAMEVAPQGSRISLRSSAVSANDADSIEISMDDQGCGIPESERKRIFEPFYSAREDGTGGLGLAISRRIVEAAGGSIDVTDAPGGGARFSLRLPSA